MSASVTSLSATAGSGRSSEVPNLQVLKSPEEGGTKKEYEEFVEKVGSFVTITSTGGNDIGYVLKNGEMPKIVPPADLSSDDAKSQLKKRQWERKADIYTDRLITLDDNKAAMFALVHENITKILKAKIKSKTGYTEAEVNNNVVWLMETLEDIMVNFEEIKPNVLALDNQLERIMCWKY